VNWDNFVLDRTAIDELFADLGINTADFEEP